jgi:hypothetical protein
MPSKTENGSNEPKAEVKDGNRVPLTGGGRRRHSSGDVPIAGANERHLVNTGRKLLPIFTRVREPGALAELESIDDGDGVSRDARELKTRTERVRRGGLRLRIPEKPRAYALGDLRVRRRTGPSRPCRDRGRAAGMNNRARGARRAGTHEQDEELMAKHEIKTEGRICLTP